MQHRDIIHTRDNTLEKVIHLSICLICISNPNQCDEKCSVRGCESSHTGPWLLSRPSKTSVPKQIPQTTSALSVSVSKCICLYVWVCLFVHVQLNVCVVYVYMYTWLYICLYVYLPVYMFICLPTYCLIERLVLKNLNSFLRIWSEDGFVGNL